jgi:5-(hydroxymethyl)furfural/furfural oxidase
MADTNTLAAAAAREADFLIVGGGSAGCTLAARLSENPRVSVVLIEAGPDLRAGTMPPEIKSTYPSRAFFTRDFFFPDLQAYLGDVPGNAPRERKIARYEQARVLGGGSSINGLCGNRGAPDDYNEWGEQGADGWSWQSVLPYFRKLERDADFKGDSHGESGPIAIHRQPYEELSGFVRASVDVLTKRGYRFVDDQNAEWGDGITRVAMTANEDNERSSAAVCYLTDEVRRRPNLTVLTGALAERVRFDGTRAIGADIRIGSERVTVRARQTIVSSGAINTPAVLMRSGVGDASRLKALGIPVVAHVPGVGQRLLEHPAIGISMFLKPDVRFPSTDRHHTQAHFRFSSGVEGCPVADLNMAVLARTAWHAVGAQLGTFYLWINKSYSEGEITLRSTDPTQSPLIDFRLLSDRRDHERMKIAFRTIAELALDPALDGVRHEVFPTIFSDRVRAVSAPTSWNAFQTAVFARVLDTGIARERLIKTFIAPTDISALLENDSMLDQFLHDGIVGVWHACGSCRMGADNDPLAVTNASGVVRGVSGLRICDASLMPSIPCANTNIPTIMLSERIADLIKAETFV